VFAMSVAWSEIPGSRGDPYYRVSDILRLISYINLVLLMYFPQKS